eukprot:scaffold54623_cov53-Phaeocystis_antarctica.AAC.1
MTGCYRLVRTNVVCYDRAPIPILGLDAAAGGGQSAVGRLSPKVADREQTRAHHDQWALSDNLVYICLRPRPWDAAVANVHLVLRPSTG